MLRRFYEVSQKKIELYLTGWFQGEMTQLALVPDALVSLPLSTPILYSHSLYFHHVHTHPLFPFLYDNELG